MSADQPYTTMSTWAPADPSSVLISFSAPSNTSGYKVRYVRNITDVGHLLDDGKTASPKAPAGATGTDGDRTEVHQRLSRHHAGIQCSLRALNPRRPHIIEQIEMVKAILANGQPTRKNSSVYFDVPVSPRRPATTVTCPAGDRRPAPGNRDLKRQDEKNHPADFAIWMKADPEHIMRWPSPWGKVFPGWHLECSAMSTKYLGKTFDIHGGGFRPEVSASRKMRSPKTSAPADAPGQLLAAWQHAPAQWPEDVQERGQYHFPGTTFFTGDNS